MRRIIVCLVSALTLFGVMADSTIWDGQSWVYTSENHTVIAPATGEGVMGGLDARARGFDDTESTTVDTWFWTIDWAIGIVSFGPCGTFLILK